MSPIYEVHSWPLKMEHDKVRVIVRSREVAQLVYLADGLMLDPCSINIDIIGHVP